MTAMENKGVAGRQWAKNLKRQNKAGRKRAGAVCVVEDGRQEGDHGRGQCIVTCVP